MVASYMIVLPAWLSENSSSLVEETINSGSCVLASGWLTFWTGHRAIEDRAERSRDESGSCLNTQVCMGAHKGMGTERWIIVAITSRRRLRSSEIVKKACFSSCW
jgi:hypothetical protein